VPKNNKKYLQKKERRHIIEGAFNKNYGDPPNQENITVSLGT
jgi:hypothetical protein